MVFWSIFLSLLLLLILVANKRKSKTKKLPPGPRPLPIIGNLHTLGKKPHQSLNNLANIYGPIMSLKLGSITSIVISSSAMAKEVFQKQDLAFSNRVVPDALYAHNYNQYSAGWLPISTRWKFLRKIMTTVLFSGKQLDANQHLRSKKVHDLISLCENSCKDGKAIDIGQAAFMTSLNLISNTIFSKDFTGTIDDSVKEMKKVVCDIFVESGKPNLADFFPLLKKIDPQGMRRRMTGYMGKLLELFDASINERLELRKVNKNAGSCDLLGLCLDISQENPEEIDMNQIKILCLDLFIAGTDTTSSTLEWAMAELIRNPEIMCKAKVELNEVIGKGKIVEEGDISKLPYLECILKETLRLHPPVPLIPRTVETDHVEVNDYIVPKGSQVLFNTWAIGRDPKIWEDSLTFNPERFLNSERDVRGKNLEFIPFGAGRRMCPGLPMAMRLLSVTLGSLINSFEWTLESGTETVELDMGEKFGMTLHKARPLVLVPMPLTIK